MAHLIRRGLFSFASATEAVIDLVPILSNRKLPATSNCLKIPSPPKPPSLVMKFSSILESSV